MKKVLKIVACVLIAAALWLTVDIVLTRSLTGILNSTWIPRAEQQLGVDIAVGGTNLDILGRELTLSDVRVARPAGFDGPDLLFSEEARLRVRFFPLLRGAAEITDLLIRGARLTLTFSSQGRVNVTESGKPDDSPQISFSVSVEARDISFEEIHGAGWANFDITGHLEEDPELFVTALDGRIAPMADFDSLSFDIQGTIRFIRLEDLGPMAKEWEIECESADMDIDVKCRNGRYAEGSKLTMIVRKPTLTGDLARKARNFPIPDELTLRAPLGGTVEEPELDIHTALVHTVLENLAGSVGTILESVTIDGEKLDGDLGEAARKLGNILKSWNGD